MGEPGVDRVMPGGMFYRKLYAFGSVFIFLNTTQLIHLYPQKKESLKID